MNISCKKCSHFEFCKTPCLYVKKQLESEKVYERIDNEKIIAVSQPFQINETSLLNDTTDESRTGIEYLFSTKSNSPFSSFSCSRPHTQIFIQRFFKGMLFKDIGDQFNISDKQARKIYSRSVERMTEALEILDFRKKVNHQAIQALKKTKAELMSKSEKCCLLNSLFNLTVPEIAEILEISGSLVSRYIKEAKV